MPLCHSTNILLITFHMPGFDFYTMATNQGSYNSRSCCTQFLLYSSSKNTSFREWPYSWGTLNGLKTHSSISYVICGGKDDKFKKKPENSLAMKNIFKQNQSALITWEKYLPSFFSLPVLP